MVLLTVQETASLLRVSPMTIRRYISSGRLPAVRIGRGVRVPRESLAQLLAPIERPTPVAPERARRGRAFTMDDSLWNIVGIGRSPDPSQVAEQKDRYVAEAVTSAKA